MTNLSRCHICSKAGCYQNCKELQRCFSTTKSTATTAPFYLQPFNQVKVNQNQVYNRHENNQEVNTFGEEENQTNETGDVPNTQQISIGYLGNEDENSAVLITAIAKIENPHSAENNYSTRIFLDNGSQKSFIKEKMATKLKPIEIEKLTLKTFGDTVP